jgi:hypothetical protein
VIDALTVAAGTPAAAAAVVVALRRSVRRSHQADLRGRTVHALKALSDVIEAGGAIPYAADALAEVLDLEYCKWEAAPAGAGGVPVLARDGHLDGRIQHRDRIGLLLPALVHLPAGPGRFALLRPGRSATLEERLVAVAIALLAVPPARS